MSFLNFINYFNGKKDCNINNFATLSNTTINTQFEKSKTSSDKVSMFLKRFDLNGDGKLDNSEIARLKKISAFIKTDDFNTNEIDTNKDNKFNFDELSAFEKKQPEKTNEINKLNGATTDVINKQYQENKANKENDNKLLTYIAAFDRNNDGKIDDNEVIDLKFASKYLQQDDDFDMGALDKDKNGKIDTKEMGVFHLAEKFDADKDGVLSEEEARDFKLAVQFDEDKDGVLSEKELAQFKMAKTLDTDKDGVLNNAELNKLQEANDIRNQIQQVDEYNNLTSGRAGNYSDSSDFSSGMSSLKAEPTIGEKLNTTKNDIQKIEKEITSVKENATKAIKEKEATVQELEKNLLIEQKIDSENVKKLKNGISEKSQAIREKETELRAKEVETDSLKNTISSDKIVLLGMEKEFAGLKTDTPNKQINAKNQARKNQLESQIQELKEKIKENEAKLQDVVNSRDTLKNEIIPKLKEERGKLENDLKETDASYAKSVDALKDARKTFEEAKIQIETQRDKKISELESELKTKREEATKLSEKDGEIKGKSGQYGAAIDSIMSRNGVLAGKGDMIAQIANEYGIPADIFAAIIAAETGRGTSKAIRNRNNPGGMMNPKTGCRTLQNFASLEDGLRKMASNLKRNYFNKGRTTLATIQPKYCPVGAANDPRGLNKNWLRTTTKLAAQINNSMS